MKKKNESLVKKTIHRLGAAAVGLQALSGAANADVQPQKQRIHAEAAMPASTSNESVPWITPERLESEVFGMLEKIDTGEDGRKEGQYHKELRDPALTMERWKEIIRDQQRVASLLTSYAQGVLPGTPRLAQFQKPKKLPGQGFMMLEKKGGGIATRCNVMEIEFEGRIFQDIPNHCSRGSVLDGNVRKSTDDKSIRRIEPSQQNSKNGALHLGDGATDANISGKIAYFHTFSRYDAEEDYFIFLNEVTKPVRAFMKKDPGDTATEEELLKRFWFATPEDQSEVSLQQKMNLPSDQSGTAFGLDRADINARGESGTGLFAYTGSQIPEEFSSNADYVTDSNRELSQVSKIAPAPAGWDFGGTYIQQFPSLNIGISIGPDKFRSLAREWIDIEKGNAEGRYQSLVTPTPAAPALGSLVDPVKPAEEPTSPTQVKKNVR